MAERLAIHRAGQPDIDVALAPGPARLGRGAACQVFIDHPEIGEHAASLEYRGGAYFVQNLCPYEVFVGQQPLPPGAWCKWRAGDRLLLSKSVSLTLLADQPRGAAPKAADAAHHAEENPPAVSDSRRKMMQLGVTAFCLVVGGLLLLMDRQDSGRSLRQVKFPELSAALEAKQPLGQDDTIIRRYLQTAWSFDQHRGDNDRQHAIHYYQLLLTEPRIHDAPLEGDSLYSRIKYFAARRVAELQAPR